MLSTTRKHESAEKDVFLFADGIDNHASPGCTPASTFASSVINTTGVAVRFLA